MPGFVDVGLEARLQGIEQQLRALRTRNPLDAGAIVNASGQYVPLSALAFGQAAAVRTDTVQITENSGQWYTGDPFVDVYVTSGRLRVDVAALLTASGNKAKMRMGYAILGPGSVPGGNNGSQVVGPDDVRCLSVLMDSQGISQEMAAGYPVLHEGLTPGWYRIESRYRLTTAAGASGYYGTAVNRRIFATPL